MTVFELMCEVLDANIKEIKECTEQLMIISERISSSAESARILANMTLEKEKEKKHEED